MADGNEPPSKKRAVDPTSGAGQSGVINSNPNYPNSHPGSANGNGDSNGQILGIPSYCLPTYAHNTIHNMSLPTSLDHTQFDYGASWDPTIGGSYQTASTGPASHIFAIRH